MATSVASTLACVLLIGMVASVQEGLTCEQVISCVVPRLPYLESGRPMPSPACCNGVKSFNAKAQTTPDRQLVCKCLKSAAGGYSGIKQKFIPALPAKCGVKLPYKIGLEIDCNSIK